jgi:hypothetical protein
MSLNVTSALLYLYVCSWLNRLRCQARRLRQPKYLVAALLGAAYMFFFFIRPMVFAPKGGTSPLRPAVQWGTEAMVIAEAVAAFGLLLFVAFVWLLPRKRAALDFTEAEAAFLFPAPVTRLTLIHYKLLKSQTRIIFSALVMTYFSWRQAGQGRAWMLLAGWWLVMGTLNLHVLGASFARTWLLERGVAHWQRRAAVGGALAAALALCWWWLSRSLPPLGRGVFASQTVLADYLQQVTAAPPVWLLLSPFRLLVGPLLAPAAADFALACVPAAALFGLHYWWVAASNVAFEEASLERARKTAAAIAVAQSAGWHFAGHTPRRVKPPFSLAPTGFRATALLWKNLIALDTIFTLRLWVLLFAGVVAIAGVAATTAGGSEVLPVIGGLTCLLAVCVPLFGPHALRVDFRQDLPMTEALKTYPLRGWQMALGEVLAPTVMLTGAQWLFTALAVVFFSGPIHRPPIPLADRLSIGIGVALMAPMFSMVSVLLFNGMALLYPAWTRLGLAAAQGFEAVGQQMLVVFAQLLALALVLLLPAAAFGLLYWIGHWWFSWRTLVPASALAATTVLALEAFAGLLWLGNLFDRLDLSKEHLSEG